MWDYTYTVKTTRTQLEQKILELEGKIKEKDLLLNEKESHYSNELDRLNRDWEDSHNSLKGQHGVEIENLKGEISSLNADLKQKQAQLDRKELKKLAAAYEVQEKEYQNDIKLWSKILFYAGAFFIAAAVASVYFSNGKVWYERIEYYLLDLIVFSIIWFSASQYSDYVRLRNDYANRKSIAQSFHNILNNLAEDELIKNKFIEKAVDVLCAPSPTSNTEPLFSKKVIKDTAEIIRSVK